MIRSGEVVLGVEILKTHAIEDDKILDMIGIPWVEILALSVIENPLVWYPVRSSILPVCAACEKLMHRASPFFSGDTILPGKIKAVLP